MLFESLTLWEVKFLPRPQVTHVLSGKVELGSFAGLWPRISASVLCLALELQQIATQE